VLVPKLRFKEFNDEWNCKLFSEIFEFIQNNSFSRDMLNYSENSKIYNIHYGDILTKYGEIIDFNMISNIVPKINNDISLLKFEDKSYLKDGDIIISDTAEDLTVGKACEITNLYYKALAGLHTIPCRPKFKFASQYLGVYINSPSYHSQLIPFVTGIKVSSISKNNIIKTIMYFPSVKEQEKISELFSLLNKKIELQQRKIEVLKMYKRGLIHKIFDNNKNISNQYKISECINIFDRKTTKNNEFTILSSTKDGIKIQDDYFNRQTASVNNIGYKIIPRNYITYRSMSDTGDFYFNIQNIIDIGIVSPAYPVFNTIDTIDINYFTNYINFSSQFKNQILINKEGGTRFALSISKFSDLVIELPKYEIQLYYSRIISNTDKKIIVEENKLKSLNILKKSLLQQMFI